MSTYLFFGFFVACTLFCMVMLWRVVKVSEWRIKAFVMSVDDYQALPEFNEMLWMIWIWKLKHFPRRNKYKRRFK
ncbi:TPA: hypothetical protein SH488_000079 [Salmonella enterica]|nr:hypothetical protein [Salmonella enterica]